MVVDEVDAQDHRFIEFIDYEETVLHSAAVHLYLDLVSTLNLECSSICTFENYPSRKCLLLCAKLSCYLLENLCPKTRNVCPGIVQG